MIRAIKKTILLLLVSAALLGCMIFYVKITQHRPDNKADLDVTVSKDVIWPWQNVDLNVRYSGAQGITSSTQNTPARITDMVFVIDTSGSMADVDVEEAKRQIMKFPQDLKNVNEMAVIEFAGNARVVAPFTKDFNRLCNILDNMKREAGGGTSFFSGLNETLKILESRSPATVILLSDGGSEESMQELKNYYENRWKPSMHELFMIGLGEGGIQRESFEQLTDDPLAHIITGMDRGALPQMFQEIKERIGDVFGRRARLTLPLSEPLWELDHDSKKMTQQANMLPNFTKDSDVIEIGTIFQKPYAWIMSITPKIGGVLPVLGKTSVLDYTNKQGKRMELKFKDPSPKVLAITPLFLLFLLLPALLYFIAALIEWLLRPEALSPEIRNVEPIRLYHPPPNLPLRFAPQAQRINWAPSLIIGLGKSGREVLTHLQQAIEDSFDDAFTRPVLLAMDTAREEVNEKTWRSPPGCLKNLEEENLFILPPESCALYEAIHQQRTSDDPASAMNLRQYRNMGVDALRLNNGTNGQAPLARLALLQDLKNDGDSSLLLRLEKTLDKWRELSQNQHQRCIIIVGNVHGGVGSGWLTDLLILLRRMVKPDEALGNAVEISALLLGEENFGPGNTIALKAPVLFAELDRLSAAGRGGFKHDLNPEASKRKDILTGWVNRRPMDNVFVLSDQKQNWEKNLYPAASDALCLLMDRARRTEFTQVLEAVKAHENSMRAVQARELYTQVSVHNAVFPKSFYEHLLIARLGLLISGRQILFPELEIKNGKPGLNPNPNPDDDDWLLTMDVQGEDSPAVQKGIDLETLNDVVEAMLGNPKAFLSKGYDDSQLQPVVNELQLIVAENANHLIIEKHRIGLAQLLESCRKYEKNLQQIEHSSLKNFSAVFESLADQASQWIRFFWGTDILDGIEFKTVESSEDAPRAFASNCNENTKFYLQTLQQWSEADSRLLVGPLANQDLNDLEKCIKFLDKKLHGDFLKIWLKDENVSMQSFASRCYWELSIPGINNEVIGIHLVFHGTETKRYSCDYDQLERFMEDLSVEVAGVLDAEKDYHILGLVKELVHPGGRENLLEFAKQLKTNLKGEKSNLLVVLPKAPSFYGSDLIKLRQDLKLIFENDVAGAAEIIRTCADMDRRRISAMQVIPLLTAPENLDGINREDNPIHFYERKRKNYADQLARELNVAHVELSQAAGLALQNEKRLLQFAHLYGTGLVDKRELDNLWYLRMKNNLLPLTFLQEQTIADAAAYFISDSNIKPDIDGLDIQRPLPDNAVDEPDFIQLMEWLLQKEDEGIIV